jgi:propionyl-CoA carboxylase beta chain
VRDLLSFLPQSNQSQQKRILTKDLPHRLNPLLKNFIPTNPRQPNEMDALIAEIVDDGYFLEVHQDFARNVICAFAAIGGISIGIVANRPSVLAGVLDINASDKAARFIRFCDSFNIPILTLQDVPGFLPGTAQEYGGIIRHGAKLLYAYAEATVPLITLITRKSYGGAYCVMAPKHLRADVNLAYPTAEIAVMGAEGAVNIIFRNELKNLSPEELQKKRAELVARYEDEFANPYQASKLGYIDEVILPEETRKKIYTYLSSLQNKIQEKPRRKHGNIPL